MLVEAYVSIVERLLQPVHNRLPAGQRPPRPFQNTLRETALSLWRYPEINLEKLVEITSKFADGHQCTDYASGLRSSKICPTLWKH